MIYFSFHSLCSAIKARKFWRFVINKYMVSMWFPCDFLTCQSICSFCAQLLIYSIFNLLQGSCTRWHCVVVDTEQEDQWRIRETEPMEGTITRRTLYWRRDSTVTRRRRRCWRSHWRNWTEVSSTTEGLPGKTRVLFDESASGTSSTLDTWKITCNSLPNMRIHFETCTQNRNVAKLSKAGLHPGKWQ